MAAKPDRAVLAVEMEEFNESDNWMIYGLSGVGKSCLAGELPDAVFWSAEPGTIAAKRRGSTAKVVRIKTWESFEKALTAAENGQYDDRKWIIVDTFSTIQQLGFRYWTTHMHDVNPKMDVDVPDQGGHQKVQFMTRRTIARLVDLPQNVLVLCHAMEVENNDGSGVWLPHIEGQAKKGYAVANYCMGLMNLIGYMGVREGKDGEISRRIIWQHTEDKKKDVIYTAKDQYSRMPRFTDDMTMDEIMERIFADTSVKKSKKK